MATRYHIPPSILTYCFNGKLVYVTPASNYEQALDFAQEVFPDLAQTPRDQISFFVVKKGDDKTLVNVRIGPMAWAPVVASLSQNHTINIHAKPTIVVQGATPEKEDAPPRYPEYESKSSNAYARARSTPASPHPRSPSDSKEKRRSWFGKD